MTRLVAALALALPLLAPAASQAQTAGDITGAFADWMSSISGEPITRAQIEAKLQVRPQGDHFAASFPLGDVPSAPSLTADIRQALGRWSIDNIRLPANADFGNAHLTIGDQASAILIDNTFTTASIGTAALTGLALRAPNAGANGGTLIQAGRVLHSAIIRPLLADRNDATFDTLAEGFSVRVDDAGAPPVRVEFAGLRASFTFDDVNRAGMAKLLQAMSQQTRDRRSGAPKAPGGVAQAFAGFTSAMTFGSAFRGLGIDTGDTTGSVKSGAFNFKAAQLNGVAQADLRVNAETLAFAAPRLGPAAGFLPTRFSLHQSVANVPVDALIHLAALSDAGTSPRLEDIQRVFALGIQASLDELLIDIGGATFTATGKSVLTGPQNVSVTGTITATNFDSLQQRVAADPALAQGLPVLIFLKGAGRTVDNRIVWDITYRDRQLAVNNQNLSAMLQSFMGGAAQPRRP